MSAISRQESGWLAPVCGVLPRMPRVLPRASATLALFLLGACMAPGAPEGLPGDRASSRRAPCILAIENHNWEDLHIYAVTESGERVMPGDGRTLRWTLRNHLALSTLVVR